MKKILVVIGEASGDLHGGQVLDELKKIEPKMEIIGTGGRFFQRVSKKTYYKAEQLEVIGWWGVLKNFQFLKSAFDKMLALLDSEKIDALFLVDYVGFNLRLAREAKKRNIPVYFYIAPQAWAWKKKRCGQIAENVKKLIVLFPFEVDFFAKENIAVECFGHPLLEAAKKTQNKEQTFQKHRLSPKKKLLCLFAGSRKQELLTHLPILLKTAEILAQTQDLQFVCVLTSKDSLSLALSFCSAWSKKNVVFVTGDFYNIAGWADLAIACSGTVTLELAVLQTPTIIFYKTSGLNFFLAKYCFGIKKIGLPNIIYGEDFLPELLQNDCTPEKLSQKAKELLARTPSKMQQVFPRFKEKLAMPNLAPKGIYKKTAEFLAKALRE
jgi:lipid-A-disaccharide synthase